MGYDAVGITPDEKQIAMVQQRYADTVHVQCVAFEQFASTERFDAVFFQESSQYIESHALFAKAAELTSHVIVLDEFALKNEGTLHRYDAFVSAARQHGFSLVDEVDYSKNAPPTVEYFMQRIPKHRQALIADLELSDQQIDDLLASGRSYVDLYQRGVYAYRLLELRR
jgi:hypothetical protein